MKERELNRAYIGVAKTTAISGRATANEINHGLRTGKQRIIGRIASLTFLWSLMLAGFLVALAPMPAHADNDKDKHEDNDKGIRAEIAALQAQVSALQTANTAQQNEINSLQTSNTNLQKEVNNLQTSNTNLQNQVNSLQTSNTTQQKQLAAVQSNHALLLGPFVNVDPNPEIGVRGPNIVFSGANIHIVSGSGRTDDNGNPRGLGNLIIGYDESPAMAPVPPPPPLNPGDRGGSHNLVIGRWHRFTRAAFGGFVAGEFDVIGNEGASVTGGFNNTASGRWASVTSGQNNTASGQWASVTGGAGNQASGFNASVSGGGNNTASGFEDATVSGGTSNTASGPATSVTGGLGNTASGPQGSVVIGGALNTVSGLNAVILGGLNVTDNKDNSIAPQPPFP